MSSREATLFAPGATDDPSRPPAATHDRPERPCIEVPDGHIGPFLLSGTGRSVWWTGRVAIGLRYEPPRHAATPSRSALWLQDVLLKCS